jgi:hypothetical protein
VEPAGPVVVFQHQAWLGISYRLDVVRGLVGSRGVVGWSLVENCTVDASILFSVVKLSRANGGCLGTRSR